METLKQRNHRPLSIARTNLDERNVYLKLDMILERLDLGEKSVHDLRYDSCMAAAAVVVSAACAHGVCFTGTSLAISKNRGVVALE